MTFGKLLSAASAIAMLAGTASAQLVIGQVDTTGTLSDGTTAIGGASTIDSFYRLAAEVDFAALTLAGGADAVFGLEVRTQGVIPPGQNIFLTIEIENGTLFANLDGSEILSGITGAVVDSGGSIGDDFVRYLITTDTLDLSTVSNLDGIALDLPVLLSSCGNTRFNVTEFRTEGTGSSGTDIEGGTASRNALSCGFAYIVTLGVDFDDTVLDFTNGFRNFVVSGPDTATTALLGRFGLSVNTILNIDLNGTAASPGDILGFEASIDFDDNSGIVSGQAAPTSGTLFTTAATPEAMNSIPLTGTTAASSVSEFGTFSLTIDGTNPVLPQPVTVSDANLFLDTGDLLVAESPFAFADVEDLELNGQFFGTFDWVADAGGLVNSIFRVTGLDGQSDIPAQIIVQNATQQFQNGTYPFTILASDVEGSEVRFNSDFLESVVGVFGTADISFVFSTNLDLDVDRLLSGPAQATVVPFGDGANQDGSGALAPATDPAGGVNGDDGSF